MRWGLPSSQKALYDAAGRRADKLRANGKEVDFDELLKLEPDSGTTNVRNIFNGTRWNAHWNRWMGVENRCVVPFTSFSEFDNTFVDGKKKGYTWFAFNESRPLAILTDPEEIEVWLTGPKEEAIELQRPLSDGMLEIVAVGKKQDQSA